MWFTILKRSDGPAYLVHQQVWCLFPELQKAEADRSFCYRDTGSDIYVLSANKPNVDSKKIDVDNGASYLFEMVCSTRRGAYRDENGKRQRMTSRSTKEQMREWLQNRLDESATVDRLEMFARPPHSVAREDGSKMVWPQARLVGIVTINDAGVFKNIVANGMGQGAAFGLGAMLLPEIMK